MKGLAAFAMRGPWQSAAVASVTALLSLIVPLVGLLSVGVVALVGLRGGARPGLRVCVLATLIAALLGQLLLGSPWAALGLLAMLWLPTLGLSLTLRSWGALALTAEIAAVAALLVVIGMHLFLGDPGAFWASTLEPVREALVADGVVADATSHDLFETLSGWMTGAIAAALLLQFLAGIFIGRWWQGLLYNPGGFGQEFRAFRLSRVTGMIAVALLVALGLVRGSGLVADLTLVLGILLMLQGLAVAHAMRAARNAHQGWLVGLYVLLVLFMPQVALLLACVGLVDIWADIRGRNVANKPGPG